MRYLLTGGEVVFIHRWWLDRFDCTYISNMLRLALFNAGEILQKNIGTKHAEITTAYLKLL